MKKKSWFYLWQASILIMLSDLIFLAIYMIGEHTPKQMIVCLAYLAAGAVLFAVCQKKLLFKEGFTYQQALSFFKECKKQDIDSVSSLMKQMDKVNEIVKKTESLNNLSLDRNQVKSMFLAGQEHFIKK